MMRVHVAVVASNPLKPASGRIARDVAKFLARRGVTVSRSAAHADLLVVVGGDGTLLHFCKEYDLPIFGIGGQHSRICQAKAGAWRARLSRALRGFSTERRTMLACDRAREHRALNDVVVKSADARLVKLRVSVGRRTWAFLADGLVFSTPTGSSAYFYSCGGRLLRPNENKFGIAAIAPYLRAFRPTVFADCARASVRLEKGTACIVVDGQPAGTLRVGETLRVARARQSVRLVRVPS